MISVKKFTMISVKKFTMISVKKIHSNFNEKNSQWFQWKQFTNENNLFIERISFELKFTFFKGVFWIFWIF